MSSRPADDADARDIVAALRRWAIEEALPLWADAGVDAERGGFHERLGLDGRPDRACVRRLMVQARQVYVFSRAAVLGWHPDAAAIAQRGFAFMLDAYRGRDGAAGFVHSLAADGAVAEPARDAYAHAFVLLALAWLSRATGEPRARDIVDETLAFLDADLADAAGGFREGVPARLPRRQNPHMHLFEAMLALHATVGHPQALTRARAILALLEDKFLDAETGTLREYFDARWRPLAGADGDHIEPGHHAEWAWLLHRHRALTGEPVGPLAERLFAVAARFADRDGLLIDAADRFGAVRHASRRVWPQTEFVKACLARHEAGDPEAAKAARRVLRAIARDYLSGPVRGAWYDRLDAEGRPDAAFVPASSFYHLFDAIGEADRVLGARPTGAA
jgi:mannose-6-phosphate isomerase